MVTPIFESAVNRLIGDVVRAPKGQAGAVASTVITIARARYTMSVMGAGDWLNFDVKGLSLFERIDAGLMESTIKYLEHRLILKLSPALLNAKCN
jgi:hypothetical protein